MKTTRATAMPCLLLTAVILMVRSDVAWSQATKPGVHNPSAAPAAALPAEDDAGIRETIKGIEEAWNAHDMDAYARLLRPDVERVNVVGMHWRGWESVMIAHITFHMTTFKNHNIRTDDIHIRPLCPDYAIAVVTTPNDAFTAPAGRVIPKQQDRQTYVLGKDPDGWKIAHCENVWVDAEAAKHDPTKAPAK